MLCAYLNQIAKRFRPASRTGVRRSTKLLETIHVLKGHNP